MIKKYTLPRMGEVWSEENKFQKWLQVELASVEARSKLGKVPVEALEEIKQKASFNLARIEEIEKEVEHDVIAFLTVVGENVGEAARYLHYGMTSSDVVDTALSLLMKEASEILIQDIKELIDILKKRAVEFKNTLMMGRTHGVHAEPITFGLKLALWAFEMRRNLTRLERAKETISYGKISGVVGTYAEVNPFVEKYVCEKLGLKPAEVSSQILQRDRHAEFLTVLAITASSLEKFATEIRHLQRTEVLEVEEPFKKGQKGSSAMPHKKNPIICERICGLARLIRSNAFAGMENIALWHERDISHSSVERIVIPDSTIALDYILNKFKDVIVNLKVNKEKMRQNLELSKGLVFSQKVLLALIEKGLSREEAYQIVQRNAFKSWEEESSFKENLIIDGQVGKLLTKDEIENIFDYGQFIKNLGVVFERLEKI